MTIVGIRNCDGATYRRTYLVKKYSSTLPPLLIAGCCRNEMLIWSDGMRRHARFAMGVFLNHDIDPVVNNCYLQLLRNAETQKKSHSHDTHLNAACHNVRVQDRT